jgi:hypothetical protein
MPDAVAKQCADAIVTVIQSLSLTGIESSEVTARKVARDAAQVRRGIQVAFTTDSVGGGTNERDDIGYGFIVTCCQGTSRGDTDDLDRVTLWRQQIRRAFHNQRLSGVNEIYICTVSPGDQFIPKELRKHNDVSALYVRCWSREQRT